MTSLVWALDAQPSGMSCRLETHELRFILSHHFIDVWKGWRYVLKMEGTVLELWGIGSDPCSCLFQV